MGKQLEADARSRWKYYQEAAEKLGRGKNGEQKNTSLAWFYCTRKPEELNDLTKAFLGDPEAQGRLCWNEPLPLELCGKAPQYDWVEAEPNANQLKAIQTALTQPISFIQGPPGTGKTKMILNLASCIAHQKNPDGSPQTVAIVSQNNAAIENVEERIKTYKNGTPAQKWVWERFAPLGNAVKRRAFTAPKADGREAREDAIAALEIRDETGTPVRVRSFASPYDMLPKHLKIKYRLSAGTVQYLRKEPYITSAFLQTYPLITSTLHSLRTCFADSYQTSFQYDYVIVDETSQASVIAGILAMSCARHLVLVGDEEQLSAFLSTDEREALKEVDPEIAQKAGGLYKIRDNENFLSVCLQVFLGENGKNGGVAAGRKIKLLLQEHYRCHPSIIGFCNEHIYGGALLPSRPDVNENKNYGYDPAVKVPIKILWYEGDYYEPGAPPNEPGAQQEQEKQAFFRRNMRQVTIFMAEEWPELVEKFRQAAPKKLRVCILTPFKDQRGELKAQILAAIKKFPEQDRRLFGPVEEVSEEERQEEYSKSVPTLTINKAQGEEYDIVYLLPVEDSPKVQKKWPWSQGKAIVNVAVSRARDELRLIVSSDLMSERVRERLKARGELQYPFSQIHVGKGEDNLYIQHLVDYVMDQAPPDGDFSEYPHQERFGFHKSRLTSVFDEVSRVRAQKREKRSEDEPQPEIWATERCMELALAKMLCRYQKEQNLELAFYRNVRIRDIRNAGGAPIDVSAWEKTLQSYLNNSAEFDFVVCEKGGRILLAIEVDGGYHRLKENVQANDGRKDQIARDLGTACCLAGNREMPETGGSFAFLRLPTDGSTYWETRELWEQLDETARAAFSQDCFPIEALIDQQLKTAATAAYFFAPVSLTKSLEKLRLTAKSREGLRDSLKRFNAASIQQELAKGPEPLLYETDGNGGETSERWTPTKAGVNHGIVRGYRLSSGGTPYCCPFYTERAQGEVLKRILRAGAKQPGRR